MRFLFIVLFALLSGCFAQPVDSGQMKSYSANRVFAWDWTDFPLEVHYHKTVTFRQRIVVHHAMRQWNMAVRFPVFIHGTGGERETGVVFIESVSMKFKYGLQSFYAKDGHILRSRIWISNDIRKWGLLLYVTLHELGHALSLDHDINDPTSVMYPLKHNMYRIQPQDLSAVRTMMFCRAPRWRVRQLAKYRNWSSDSLKK